VVAASCGSGPNVVVFTTAGVVLTDEPFYVAIN
jgi:hypothetical protein